MIRNTTPLLAALLLLLIMPTPVQADQQQQLPANIQKMIDDASTEHVVVYDDYRGYLWFEAMGNAGSVMRMHLYYTGFYIRPIQTLSMSKQGIISDNPQSEYQDIYEILPKSFSANITVSTKKHCRDETGDHISTVTAHLSENYVIPPPPNLESIGPEIPQWMYSNRSKFHGGKVRTSIHVNSKQPDGGEAYCLVDAYALIEGVLTRSWGVPPSRSQHVKIFFGQNPKAPHVTVNLAKLTWVLGDFFPITKEFSLKDPSLSFSGTTTKEYGCQSFQQTLSDTSFTIRYKFSMAAQKQIEAELEPVDDKEKIWMPTPGEIREYKVTLKEPGPDEVEAVKFVLTDTSQHKGVATNGGSHMRGDKCEDCTLGVKAKSWPWEVFFPSGGTQVSVMRNYTHYNECPIDSLPDMYFTDADNDGWTMGDDAVSDNLQYTMSQSIETDQISGDTCTVKLRVMDGAASAKLRAYVKVAGLWYGATAKGDTADSDGYTLLLPLDKDHDGLQDTWESQWGVGNPDDDADSLMSNPNRGDGVTVFEEYRGIYAKGNHHRMSPVYVDVFTHDYTGAYNSDLRQVESMFRNQEISLWRLAGNEFKYDSINYDDGEHKNGDQYIIVVMDLNQCPGVSMRDHVAGFTTIGPPTRNHNTVIMRGSTGSLFEFALSETSATSAGTLAHEIGHQMSLPHHGDAEGRRNLNGDEVWIACLGGQHSGDSDCIMKYNCADKFIDLDWVPETNLGRWLSGGELVDYTNPMGADSHFCTSSGGSGQCGNATNGNCLSRINVKSY